MKAEHLIDYIRRKFSTQRDFAKAQSIKPQRVTEMISRGDIVVEDTQYSKRRELKESDNER